MYLMLETPLLRLNRPVLVSKLNMLLAATPSSIDHDHVIMVRNPNFDLWSCPQHFQLTQEEELTKSGKSLKWSYKLLQVL